jgi:hypothetical protein
MHGFNSAVFFVKKEERELQEQRRFGGELQKPHSSMQCIITNPTEHHIKDIKLLPLRYCT